MFGRVCPDITVGQLNCFIKLFCKYTMYPWSLHTNLFMGGQRTLAMNHERPYNSTWKEKAKKKTKNKQTLSKLKRCALHWPNLRFMTNIMRFWVESYDKIGFLGGWWIDYYHYTSHEVVTLAQCDIIVHSQCVKGHVISMFRFTSQC